MSYKFNPFTGKLDDYGPILTGTGTVAAAGAGTAALPGIAFASDLNTGIYSPGADQVAITTGGTGRLFVTSAGLVGVGTVSPADTLDVRASSATGRFEATGGTTPAYQSYRNSGGSFFVGVDNSTGSTFAALGYSAVLWQSGARAIAFGTNNLTRAVIDSSGRLGVGTASPGATLTVIGGPSVDGTMFPSGNLIADFNSNVGDTELITFGNQSITASTFTMAFVPRRAGSVGGQHGWYQKIDSTSAAAASYTLGTLQRASSGGAPETPRFHITSAGLVGIGTVSPGGTLDVKAAASTAPLIIQGSSSEFARIDSSGRLLVGNSITGAAGALAQVEGGSTQLSLRRNPGATTGGVQCLIGRSRGSTAGSYTSLISGDTIGTLFFQGADGTADVTAASIAVAVDGIPGANDMPGRLVFSTTADGAASPTERMRIKSSGIINFSNAPVYADNAAATTGGLAVGDVYRTSTGQLMIRF